MAEGGKRILVVDDDPLARRLVRTNLQAGGHEVEEAGSGIEAVERCEARAFDLVIMDLNMPGLDGWMAISLIRARRPSLPVVILTAMTGADLKQRAETAGAAGFLAKPAQPAELERAVARATKS
jgi:two-component system response regulator FlrC